MRFLARASPSKLEYNGAFRNFLGSVTKNGYLKMVQSGDPLGRQGVESLGGGGGGGGGGRPLSSPPLNPLLILLPERTASQQVSLSVNTQGSQHPVAFSMGFHQIHNFDTLSMNIEQ